MVITWQFGSENPENSKNFSIIAEWWKALQANNVLWKQRLIPEDREIDWSSQKFDETLLLFDADVRGITLYWRKDESSEISGITPTKLELAPALQRLDVYPENQENLVIRVEVPEPIQQTFTMENPGWFSEKITDSTGNVAGYRLIVRDHVSHTEMRIEMNAGNFQELKQAVCER